MYKYRNGERVINIVNNCKATIMKRGKNMYLIRYDNGRISAVYKKQIRKENYLKQAYIVSFLFAMLGIILIVVGVVIELC